MSTVLIKESGLPILVEHSVPIPLYDLGHTVIYDKDEKDGSKSINKEAAIVGYEIMVFEFKDADTNMYDTSICINYHLDNGDEIYEDLIKEVYTALEEEDAV